MHYVKDLISILSCLFVFTVLLGGQTTIHCWDFNGTTPFSSPINTNNRVTGDGTITFTVASPSDFTGSTTNACSGSSSGDAFSPVGTTNNGTTMTLSFSTLGFEDIMLSFAARKTSTGFSNNTLEYSTNGGGTFTEFPSGSPFNPSTSFSLETFDLSSITTADNNSNFQIRITFNGATSGSGNNRYDNITLSGTAILPIELSSFEAHEADNSVYISWKTESELNNDYFIVQHCIDAVNYMDIGKIEGAGNSSSLNRYDFTHHEPSRKSNNYYRLKQVDFNGKFSFSKTLSVAFEKNDRLIIYPTIVRNIINIEFPKELLFLPNQTIIYDINGKIISRINTEENRELQQVNLGDLIPGQYFISVTTNNNSITQKFIKMN